MVRASRQPSLVRSAWALGAAVALVVALTGCGRPQEPSPAAPQAPASAPAALARAGERALGLPELREAVAQARALQLWRTGQRPADEALKGGELRLRIAEQAIDRHLMRDEIERRGLALPAAEVEALLERAAQGAPPDVSAATTPLSQTDPATLEARLVERYADDALVLRDVATDLVRQRVLIEALLDDVTPAEREAQWRAEETRIVASLVSVLRVATSSEIDAWQRAHGPEIAAHYAANKEDFETATRRRVRRVFLETDSRDPSEVERLRAEAERLRALLASGVDFDALPVAPGVRVTPWRVLSRKQFPPAFGVPLHSLSGVVPAAKGLVVFKVEEETQGQARPLEDPRVQREIAAQLRRDADDLPTAKRLALQAHAALRASSSAAALEAALSALDLKVVQTEAFSRANGRRVPRLGFAPELHDALFAAKSGQVVGPLTVRQHLVVARVDSRTEPAPDAWAQQAAAWTTAWRARTARERLDTWLDATSRQRGRSINREALLALPWTSLAVSAPAAPRTPALGLPPAASAAPQSGEPPSAAPRP